MVMKLANRNAIITGASQGLGRVIAQRFIEEGANVLLCARDAQLLETCLAELQIYCTQPAQKILVQQCDVSKEADVEALFDYADKHFGNELHILVNNAGVYGPKGLTEEVDLEEWKHCLNINLLGTLMPCRLAIRRFKQAGYGKIINLSGGGATNPLPQISAYAASKSAVVRLTETLAEELIDHKIDVNAVAPGALNTRLLDEVLEAGPEKVGESFYQKALQQAQNGGVPLELGANLCVYLASAESDGITGRLLSAKWDPWPRLHTFKDGLTQSDIYTLRRITPEDRGETWPLEEEVYG